ncbi:prolyl oligopeptidase family serine peptidase [Algibacter luteus]|uniref:prolyl oligopeptidase n=1 Tax=Algibacter luteus TaxID=1178825 RepID=A0A1M6C5J4_9FLAO|nr:prolyl oligopeptidase family serine peptidase [Algibacter luteus]SHI56286.1 prolyl oligopeptidase [Algibacter luteus]
MKFIIVLLLVLVQVKHSSAQIEYPISYEKPVVSNYHGFDIVDEYIWLETQENESVVDWIESQNKISEKYLKRQVAQHHTDEYMNKYLYSSFGDFDGKLKRNIDDDYFFSYFITSGSTTPSLFYKKGVHSRYYMLVNSTSISRKDKIDIDYYKISKNNTWLAYKYNRNGSDWHEIRVVKIDKKRHYLNVLKHTLNSGIYWWNDGFFYKKYPFDSINATYKKPTIMYHKVDTKQEDDQIMFKSYSDDEDISVVGTKDESFYMVKRENTKTEIYNYYLFNPLRENIKLGFSPFLINTKYDLNFYKATDSLLYATTEINDKQQLISIDKEEPTKFKLISPSYDNYELQNYEFLEDFIVASYHSFNGSFLVKFDYQGKVLNECVLPKGLSVTDMYYSNNYEAFFFYLSSYTIPEVRYRLNLETFKYELVSETNVNFDFKNYKFKQDYYTSSDGTKVPIFIVYKDSLKQDKSTPFLLKTYGGYGKTNIPSYNPGIIYFIENGGAFAYTHIRGSGGFGKKWVTDGQRLNKKNGIADFISAAEYLIENNYTAPKKIAITGASHGGLITGAALTQRPDLFGSAVINVGALDMIRFENFTIGSAVTNIQEFGSTKNLADFNNILSYSPYHNINNTINYPPTLLVTGTDDNRVPPFHSYKFAAKLQNVPSQKNPILLWAKDKTGHSGANTRSVQIKEYNYIYSFLFHQLK